MTVKISNLLYEGSNGQSQRPREAIGCSTANDWVGEPTNGVTSIERKLFAGRAIRPAGGDARGCDRILAFLTEALSPAP
jgi:hypothetical protein